MQLPADLTHQNFFDSFIKGMVIVGKHDLAWDKIKTREGAYKLYELIETKVQTLSKSSTREESFRHLVRIRNTLQPGTIGAFDGLRGELLNRTLTLVEIYEMLDGCRHYGFTVYPSNAIRELQNLSSEMLQLLDESITTFLVNPTQSLLTVLNPPQQGWDSPISQTR
ncbi:MAG: hypothetical protein WAZ18_00670 [Alphaproteobacteria bacterium]